MNRINGVIVALVGIVIIAAGVLKIVTLLSTGFALTILGLALAGLSFIGKPSGESEPEMPVLKSLVAIFYAPAEVFKNLRRHPRWVVALLLSSIISTIYINAFYYKLTPERIANYTVDKTLKMSMIADNDEAKKKVEDGREQAIADAASPVMRIGQSISGFVWLFFVCVLVAFIFKTVASSMGGQINFWQALSIAAYNALPIHLITYLLSFIILITKNPGDIHPIIGQTSLVQDSPVFLVSAGAYPILFSILSTFSLVGFYRIWLNVVGLRNAGERVSSTIAWTASIIVWLLGVAFAVVIAVLFGSFFG